MPYIKQERRFALASGGTRSLPQDAGELNYTLTLVCVEYLGRKGLKYANLNEIIGALECAKLEMYRRVAAPYEDTKIVENGDVYRTGNQKDSQDGPS